MAASRIAPVRFLINAMIATLRKSTLSAVVILTIAGCTDKADTTSSSSAAPPSSAPSSAPQPALTTPTSKYSLIVPVSIQGKTYQFLLATGNGYTVVDNRVAAVITRLAEDNEVPPRIRQNLAGGASTADGKPARNDFKLWHALQVNIGSRAFRSATP
jgi:hypothetical protein